MQATDKQIRAIPGRRSSIFSSLLVGVAASGCFSSLSQESKATPASTAQPSDAGSHIAAWRIDRSTVDTSADPCSDFYQHVCGGWAVQTNIPPDRAFVDWTREAANKANDQAFQELLTGAVAADDPEARRLQTFFSSCMAKGAEVEQASYETLKKWVTRIDGLKNRPQLMQILIELHAHGVDAFFRYSGEPDRADKTRYRGEIHQGVLGLSRGAYSENGPSADEDHRAYREHMKKMFVLAGVVPNQARRDANAVFDLEVRLAAVSLSFGDRFDPEVSEHPLMPKALVELAPNIDWAAYLKKVEHTAERTVNVTSPAYLKALDALVAKRSLADLRAYLRWRFLQSMAPALPASLADEHYRFSAGKGVQRSSRSDECRFETLKVLGVELSRQFSLRFVGPEARDRAKAAARKVQDEVARSMQSVTWLSPGARAASEEKIKMLDLKIGFPDAWPAVGSFPLREDAFLENLLAAQAFEQKRAWERVATTRNRHAWEMTVYPNGAPGMAAARLTIPNGFPDLLTNSMIITAARLMPPLFDANAPAEVRYGTFGSLIGHEIVHVLDIHQIDSEGEFRDSWSKEDVQARERRAGCVVEQASQFVAFESTHLDGKQTVHENVADLSGVAYAYRAMLTELSARALHERGEDGLTAAKRFFIAYAQSYCSAERPEYLRENIKEDGHAPSKFRVNGTLSNLPAFSEAFSCPQNAPMVRPESSRCAVW